jgi:hypothetical protein
MAEEPKYWMINSHDGELVAVFEAADSACIRYVESCHVVNQLCHLKMTNDYSVVLMDAERNELVTFPFPNFDEASNFALFNFGCMVDFDPLPPKIQKELGIWKYTPKET